MVNTEIRLIIFFSAKDGEALYSQQKQDQELTVAQTMNSLGNIKHIAQPGLVAGIIHQGDPLGATAHIPAHFFIP